MAEQIPAQIRPWAPRGPFFVNVGGVQRQEIPQNRPQLHASDGEPRNAFGPPSAPREQVIGFLRLEDREYDLVPEIAAPYAEATAA